MNHPSRVIRTKHLIGQARYELAQFEASLFHTQQLIDGSIQQMRETQELLSRVGRVPDLMGDTKLLGSGTGDRANDKHRDPPRP